MPVSTIKFSQFAPSNLALTNNQLVGISGGVNSIQPWIVEWTTPNRPTPFNGLFGYNTTLAQYEFYDGTDWLQFGVGSGTVEEIIAGAGLAGGTINVSGTISLLPAASLTLLANTAGTSEVPVATTLTAFIDASFGATQGDVLYRGASGWVVLPPGGSGQVLTSGGTAANVSWSNAAAGTVTSIATGTGLTGGTITSSGTIAFAAIATNNLLANTTGSNAAPIATTLTALIDSAIGSVQGDILFRGSSTWDALSPGTAGQVLSTGGSAANPTWIAAGGSGTVTSIATNNGITGGTITTTGTLGLATIANLALLGNVSGGPLAPAQVTATAFLDACFGSAQGDILYRNGTVWTVLAPGTSGEVLSTGGVASNPSWIAAGGTGTVTSIATGNGITGGTITTTGTLGLSVIANNTFLGNISGGPAAPTATTLPLALSIGGTNADLTASNGGIFYSTASAGAILSGTATANQVLMSGASNAPLWSTATYPATTTINQILYSSSANVLGGLATVNSAGLLTSSGGVPGWVAYTGTGNPVLSTSPTLTSPQISSNIRDTTGANLLGLSAPASAVNYVNIVSNTTGNAPAISAIGSDTNISLTISGKGTGGISIGGYTDGSAAASGTVGQLISSVIAFASSVSTTTNTIANVTSISVTPGRWFITGNVNWDPSATATAALGWISTSASGTPDASVRITIPALTAATNNGYTVPGIFLNVSSNTTVYLNVLSTFATGTVTACGGIFALRI